ncbi:PaaI family thioesterase [Sphingomonas ginsenosidivorax]|uniref:PaaI family thioesterase n=1 Tax=Sphingomonas ginsenosidivorax TaxID=862135 RepID=A0A5C6U9V4_9SPHN|nr:PaaI family thioesterase [Sphingomonas ginsenosidivorax]TXC69747.1 PaaI family thioesterase [Sphingomonas ginsenosidivorax]
MTEKPHFIDAESAAHPGWRSWALSDPTRFNTLLGPMLYRVDADMVRVRITPEHRHSNLQDNVHGGALLGFIDVALFAAARGFGVIETGTAVTLDLNTQFIAAGRIGEPIEAQVELLKETGRLLFLRGLVVQGTAKIAAFSGTIRKPSKS